MRKFVITPQNSMPTRTPLKGAHSRSGITKEDLLLQPMVNKLALCGMRNLRPLTQRRRHR